MKLGHANNDAVSSGAERTKKFGVANNGKAFKVLSDSIYQDKIGSMIRETACNGLDSHIQNGNPDRPIEIHLPNAFEPYYSVQDFGLGMSPDAIDSVFTVYFESTKAQSNDVIGAFGLGAKTPFAYTDKFTVTTVKDGTKWMYVMYYNNNSEPQCDLMFEEETDEENGVKIEVPVKPEHFREFRDSLRSQLRFFPVKPIIHNGGDFKFEDMPKATLETESVTVLDTSRIDSYSDLRKSFIVQGPVGYAIDDSMLMRKMDECLNNDWVPGLTRKHVEFLRVMLRTATWFKFPIGEIGVTASREGVEYTEYTVTNFAKKIAAIHDEMLAHVESTLTGAKNAYERVALLNRMVAFRNLIEHINIDIGNAKKDRYAENYSFNLSDSTVWNTTVMAANGTTVRHTTRNFLLTSYERSVGGSLKTSRQNDVELTPNENDDTLIILRDTNSRPILRLRQYFDSNPSVKRVVVIAATGTLDIFNGTTVIDSFRDAFGGFDANIIRLSDCPEPPAGSAVRNRAAYTRPSGYKVPKWNVSMDSIAKWDRVYESPDDPEFGMSEDGKEMEKALYIIVERQRVVSNVDTGLYAAIAAEGMTDGLDIYGFRSADEEKLQNSGIEWIPLQDFLDAKREEIRTDKRIKKYTYAQKVSHSIGNRVNANLLKMDMAALHPKSELHTLKKMLEASNSIVKSNTISDSILRIANHSLPSQFGVKIARLANRFADNNPLAIKALPYSYSDLTDSETRHMIEYINWNAQKAS